LHSNFASANRGACIQNCRRSYIVTDAQDGIEFEVDNEFIMSAKDLCTIDFIDKILDAGVSVLKIEGRGRAPDYVFTVTQCYNEAIQAYLTNSYSKEKVADWMIRLSTVFNRGFWDGYYLGRKIGEWSNENGSKSTKRKIYLAKGMKYFAEAGIGEFKCESHELSVNDEIIITGPTTGYLQTSVNEIRIDGLPVDMVERGQTFTIKTPERIRPSDKLYKLIPEKK
jgi:putative protease